MIDLSNIAGNITLLEEGIWISKEKSAVSYPDSGNSDYFNIEEKSFWFKHRNNCIIDAVKRFPPSGPIFDIGGGNGFVSFALNNNGFETVLVEPGISGIRNARSRGLSHVICSTIENAGFYERSIPAIGIFDVLEHIKDDVGFLNKLKSLLVPGGMLYITVPAYNWLWSVEDDCAGHFRRYTLRDITAILTSAGYDVKYGTYFFSLLPIPILLFRVLPSKLGFIKRSSLRRNQKEHVPNKIVIKLLDIYLAIERRIIKNYSIAFGASCLIIARKSDCKPNG